MLRKPTSGWTLALIAAAVCCLSSRAGADGTAIEKLRQDAQTFEKLGQWENACDAYERILRQRLNEPGVRDSYIQCVRRLWQARRHHDDSYRKEVLGIEYGQAMHLYDVVRDLLLDHSLERKRLTAARLFRMGMEELDFALADPFFCQQHVPEACRDKIAEFRVLVQRTWGELRPASRKDASKEVAAIALAAQSYLRLNASVVVMEFTCGSCYALDEYTVYLTPAQLRELLASLHGPVVGVGITLTAQDNKVLIQQVELGSPAARAMVSPNEQVLAIDKKAVAGLPLEAVAALLDGPVGSVVELDVLSPLFGMRTVPMRREALVLPSVTLERLLTPLVGYVRITAFQDSTPKELDDALARLTAAGMKSLIIDLRGNGGGLFESAVEVARRFLASGVIATKLQLDDKANIVTTLSEAKNPAALTLPLVLLIDAETASSAEVLAGALKDHGRATLVGQTTYGKGCTQFLLKLPEFKGGLPAGGMRLTVAKVYSPKGQPYTGHGVVPHIAVDMPDLEMSASMMQLDPQLNAAQVEAQRFLMMSAR